MVPTRREVAARRLASLRNGRSGDAGQGDEADGDQVKAPLMVAGVRLEQLGRVQADRDRAQAITAAHQEAVAAGQA